MVNSAGKWRKCVVTMGNHRLVALVSVYMKEDTTYVQGE